jgi:hypothetical protein
MNVKEEKGTPTRGTTVPLSMSGSELESNPGQIQYLFSYLNDLPATSISYTMLQASFDLRLLWNEKGQQNYEGAGISPPFLSFASIPLSGVFRTHVSLSLSLVMVIEFSD